MVKLSIIIVNYNVKHFLEQCLHSVYRATKGLDAEVFVVDNNSVDGSVRMLKDKFPDVITIANKNNLGFSKANNQAIKQSKGEYILLLNPDTVVEDDTFVKILDFMDKHPDAGGLGVKMVDGSGKFLPESKRGLPTPVTSFYKIFGLSTLFPKSRRFSRYHMGHLPENEIHQVEILAGAFMLLRKSVIDEVGMLDETFFMYGEDIDLSYRIIKAGHKNYYFPKTRIIHYKGESTKKGSINYVFTFYNAMIIFANKHFSQQKAKMFTLLINIAIYFRAGIALLNRFLKRAAFWLLDAAIIYLGIYLFGSYWSQFVLGASIQYPAFFQQVIIPVYIFIWLVSVFLSGGYDAPILALRVVRGVFWGTILILVFYALLPDTLRFSRAMILIGASWGLAGMLGVRLILSLMGSTKLVFKDNQVKRFIIIGEREEVERVSELLKSTAIKPDYIGWVRASDQLDDDEGFIGSIRQVPDIISIYKINEIIFCSKDISHELIIDKMAEWHKSDVTFKIAPEDSLSIIGSNSINTKGDLYTVHLNAIDNKINKRHKGLFDVLMSLTLLASLPINLFIVKRPIGLLANIFRVLIGKYSWVGYCLEDPQAADKLPYIRRGILCPADALATKQPDALTLHNLNLRYARDYKFSVDLNIVFRAYRLTGREPKQIN